MMRLLSLFFAAALFVCYSGLCGDAFGIDNLQLAGPEMAGCHETGHNGGKTEYGVVGQKLNSQADADSTSCCHDGLVNIHADKMPQLDRIVVAEIDFTNLNRRTFHSEIIESLSPREHDPPDLQIINSTFLL